MPKTINDALNHPDFWGPETTDEDRKWALSQADKTFASKPAQEQDQILSNFAKTREKSQQRENQDRQVRESVVAPQMVKQQTKFEQFVAPLTEAVGRGVEMATIPAVGLARMAQGESPARSFGPETFTTVGAGGKAQDTRTRVASNIIPQSPWQAGAIGAQFVPGVGQAGALARIGASAGAAGGLQGLLGGKGLLEGGSLPEAGMEALAGATKGGATQATGEVLGKALGAGARHVPGLKAAINNAEARAVNRGAAQVSPEYAKAGRTASDIGEFYKMGGASKAREVAFADKLSKLENQLVETQGHPYIDTPELRQAFKVIAKGADPRLRGQIKELAPTSFGFTPQQVAKLVGITREQLTKGEGASLELGAAGVKDLVSSVEKAMPAAAQGAYSKAREGLAKSSALEDLLSAAFKPSHKGYELDMNKLQATLSNDRELARRLTSEGFGDLVQAATRGATRRPGFADQPAGNWNFVPVSSTGVKATLLKHLLQRYRYVGQKPLTVPPGGKAGLGVATTAYAGSKSKKEE